MRGRLFVATCLAGLLVPALGHAQVTRQACVEAYENAQTTSKHHQLAQARQHIRTCLDSACPSSLRSECAGWLKEIDSRQPSILLGCTGPSGEARTDAEVKLDGAVISKSLDGKALDVDPGSHEFTFTLPGESPLVMAVVVREGEKMQRVVGLFPQRPRPPAAAISKPPPPIETTRPVPWPVFALGGVTVLGVGTWAALGIWGNSGKSDLEACTPNCSHDATDDVRTRYIVGDVMLAVAIVAAGAATFLYLTRGEVRAPQTTALRF